MGPDELVHSECREGREKAILSELCVFCMSESALENGKAREGRTDRAE